MLSAERNWATADVRYLQWLSTEVLERVQTDQALQLLPEVLQGGWSALLVLTQRQQHTDTDSDSAHRERSGQPARPGQHTTPWYPAGQSSPAAT